MDPGDISTPACPGDPGTHPMQHGTEEPRICGYFHLREAEGPWVLHSSNRRTHRVPWLSRHMQLLQLLGSVGRPRADDREGHR